MDNPKIVAPDPEPAAENRSGAVSASRKTLHQKILGTLRPLPLQYHWTVWYEKHLESSNYAERLYVLHEDVADIGTFYKVYNNYPWDKVKLRDTVHIFRKGTKPVWEDPENRKGGRWTFRVPKAKSQVFFHEVAILCMANEFQVALEAEHDHVIGVSTSVRFNSHLISIWNKSGSNLKAIKAIEDIVLQRVSPYLRPASAQSYFYKRHDEHEGFKAAVEEHEASANSGERGNGP
ncbi:hypothetical protein ACJ73_06188 [Blastomyces percursus]|uniref:Translation initiation factor eIF4E n=1 Tax=Blastomyces percursus TaxID=1658174 RepID=A0A1J9R1V4_9EURO|nr:hypothetical protein ACJ73_06188 [Blastomyces percursus]